MPTFIKTCIFLVLAILVTPVTLGETSTFVSDVTTTLRFDVIVALFGMVSILVVAVFVPSKRKYTTATLVLIAVLATITVLYWVIPLIVLFAIAPIAIVGPDFVEYYTKPLLYWATIVYELFMAIGLHQIW